MWDDYRRLQGDMPVSITIPAGAASAALTIMAVTNETLANPETVLLTVSTDPTYNVGSAYNATVTILPAGSSGGDTTPPTVSMTSPANGATVSGSAVTV